jgi:hypothetical protein
MKRLAVAAAMVVAFNCQAQSAATFIAPSPLGIVLTVGTWINDIGSRNKVYLVQVKGIGRTEAEARKEGFKVAVENAVGTLVLSESQVTNQDVARRDIIEYSSGFVTKYTVLEKQQHEGQAVVFMDVYVSESKIANRLMNKSENLSIVEGSQLHATVSTLQNQTRNGDKVISAVLNDYPSKAFNILNQPVSLVRNQDRTISIHIPYTMEWNKDYLRSLGEAISRTNEGVDYYNRSGAYRIVVREGNRFTGKSWDTWTADRKRYDQFFIAMDNQPKIKVSVTNAANRVVYEKCVDAVDPFVELVDNRVVIEGSVKTSNRKIIAPGIDERMLPEMTRLNLSVVRSCAPDRAFAQAARIE